MLRITKAIPAPARNGSVIPAAAIPKARLPLRRMDDKSSSRPTRKRKKRSPMLATDSSIGMLHVGNTRCIYGVYLPKADGPNKIPPFEKNKDDDGKTVNKNDGIIVNSVCFKCKFYLRLSRR